MLIYQGRFPRTSKRIPLFRGLRGGFKYPLAYGYACVGKVVEIGKQVNSEWLSGWSSLFNPIAPILLANQNFIVLYLPISFP